MHYFAINDIHAEIYSAVVYYSDSVLNQIFCDYMDTDLKLGKFHTGLPSNRAWLLGKTFNLLSVSCKQPMLSHSIL